MYGLEHHDVQLIAINNQKYLALLEVSVRKWALAIQNKATHFCPGLGIDVGQFDSSAYSNINALYYDIVDNDS